MGAEDRRQRTLGLEFYRDPTVYGMKWFATENEQTNLEYLNISAVKAVYYELYNESRLPLSGFVNPLCELKRLLFGRFLSFKDLSLVKGTSKNLA